MASLALWVCFALFWVTDLNADWLAAGICLLFWGPASGHAATNTALFRAALWLVAALVAHLGRSMQESIND